MRCWNDIQMMPVARSLGYALVLSLVVTPAFARIPMAVPEPTSLSILGAGVAGAIIAYRMRRRK